MNYYLDQEFHEYFKKPISWLPTIGKFNKPYHTIELISIGIVAEDGRSYYAVCNEFDLKSAVKNSWLYENVLTPILGDLYIKNYVAGEGINGRWNMNKPQLWMISGFGKSKKQIAQEVKEWISSHKTIGEYSGLWPVDEQGKEIPCGNPVFYGYYADYDWVLFCSLYGTMIDLPKGFPMYCKDLKQMLDEKAETYDDQWTNGDETTDTKLSWIKNKNTYPKQTNEHYALADAKWNKELHAFIKTLN